VSIISNVVVFPVNFLIAFLFKRSKRHNQLTSRVGDSVRRMRASQRILSDNGCGPNRDPQLTADNVNSWAALGYSSSTPDVLPVSTSSSQSTESDTDNELSLLACPCWRRQVRSSGNPQVTYRVSDTTIPIHETPEFRPQTQCGEGRESRQSFSSAALSYCDSLTSNERPSGTVTKKKVFLLPWWCSIISWVLLWITVGVSFAFVTYYAIQFQDEKCKKWLTSLLIGFFSSVLLTQPVKVLLFTFLYAVICKKPIDDEVDEEDLESQDPILQSDEAWLHNPRNSRMYL